MAYSEVKDLIIEDLILNPSLDKQKYVDRAAEEMDSKLGYVYVLPIHKVGEAATEDAWKSLPRHEVLLLKSINNRLASGRLILGTTTAAEQSEVNAYGLYLINEALTDLMSLANGVVDLTADLVGVSVDEAYDKTPVILQEDDESLLLGFTNTVMKGIPWRTEPGSL